MCLYAGIIHGVDVKVRPAVFGNVPRLVTFETKSGTRFLNGLLTARVYLHGNNIRGSSLFGCVVGSRWVDEVC